MAKLEAYDKALDYSYAPGIFPATECLKNAKKRCMRLLVSSNGLQSEGVQALERDAQEAGVRVEVADRALERISKKENCFAAMVYKKAEGRFDEDSPHIVLHHPSDSGNLGTILRTADALGLDGVIYSASCDIYSPKVVRATMGSLFRVPLCCVPDIAPVLEACRCAGVETCAAVVSGAAELVGQCRFSGGTAIVIGNEGNGLPETVADACDRRVTIPMHGTIESLNAAMAAGIILWEVQRTAQDQNGGQ